jgi:crotonobetaine/carnitine-CoA ligase
MGSLLSGSPFIMSEKSLLKDFWEVVSEHSITIFFYTPQIIYSLLSQTEENNARDTNLRVVYGPRISKKLWTMFEKRFGVKLLSGYCHDASGLCLSNEKFHTKVGSIGVPTKYYDVRIWDENNKDLPIGQTGEMVVKAKEPEYEFSGYYRLKDKNKESRQNGWFKTGDAAYRDVEGYFYYIDKIEKCLLINGRSISSSEIEDEINSYPHVLTSMVEMSQSESDLSSYIINVKVIPRKGKRPDTNLLREFCREKLLGVSIDRMEIEIVSDFSPSLTNHLKLTM